MLLLKVIKCSRIAWDFLTLLSLNQGQVSKAHFWKRCNLKSDFQWLWQTVHLSTKSAINKPAMSYRTTLDSCLCLSFIDLPILPFHPAALARQVRRERSFNYSPVIYVFALLANIAARKALVFLWHTNTLLGVVRCWPRGTAAAARCCYCCILLG